MTPAYRLRNHLTMSRGFSEIEVFGLYGIGAGIGISLSFAVGFLGPILYDVSPRDPVTYVVAVSAMVLIAFAACWFPARRAIGIDPVKALRTG